uniref:cupin domain-containing protein n=1 Tax=Candidatus Electronema sp. TaxID=2698783 RepID=UPI004056EA33
MTAAELIRLLQLEPHPLEGGYFRRTYESSLRCDCGYGGRPLLTSIYYLLTQESPIGLLHRNRSDILHYHQRGAAVKYLLISPEGSLSERISSARTLRMARACSCWFRAAGGKRRGSAAANMP